MIRVALMSSWNAICGVSIHAELIGREIVKMSHYLRVFAPIQYEDDGTRLCFLTDEPYVTRNYSFMRYGDRLTDEEIHSGLFLDPSPLLQEDFDLLIVEKPSSVPLKKLIKALHHFQGKTLAIIHEDRKPENPYFYKPDWDSVVVFDERYKELFSDVFSDEKIHIVPYPCHPIDVRDKELVRRKLNLPEDVDLVLSFGRIHKPEELLSSLFLLWKRREFTYLCLTGTPELYASMKRLEKRYPFLRIKFDRPPIGGLYDYLNAADAILMHREEPRHITGEPRNLAISSAAHLCLGALVPVLCSDVALFSSFKGEVLKYRNLEEMKKLLELVLDGKVNDLKARVRKFVNERSADKIARKLLEIGLS